MIEPWEQTASGAMLRHMRREIRELRAELKSAKRELERLDGKPMKYHALEADRDLWRAKATEYYQRLSDMACKGKQ